MTKLKKLTPKQQFLELVLEILNSSLTADGLLDAKCALGELSQMWREMDLSKISDSFDTAQCTFNELYQKFQGTEQDSLSNDEYRNLLTKLRDELMEANDLYSAS